MKNVYKVSCILYGDALNEFKKQYIVNALNNNNWNISRTAITIGLKRCYIHKLIAKFGIKREV
jgi:two-component system nitrogen regulation response regulator NtrX